jgi:hypothetical protein
MIPTLVEPAIALEITLSEPLCRRLQQLLDCYPNLSLDDLAHIALTNSLQQTDSPDPLSSFPSWSACTLPHSLPQEANQCRPGLPT